MITERATNMKYVGQAKDIKARWNGHIRSKANNMIDRAIQKHGATAFDWDVLELCDEEDLNGCEAYWISKLKTRYPDGYNMTWGNNIKHRKYEDKELLNDIINRPIIRY